MLFSLSASTHQLACKQKQNERQALIDSLPCRKIQALSIPQIVSQCDSGSLSPSTILSAYAKKSLRSHKATNCLSDVMFAQALASSSVGGWGPGFDGSDASSTDTIRDRSLLGVPVSIKDTVNVVGHDTTIGYSSNVGKPATTSASISAIVHAKTTVPIGLLSIETTSDVFGTTRNPHNLDFTPGGSSGGGAALPRFRRHDIGGSGVPGDSHHGGCATSMKGLEGIPIVSAPMASTLDDLSEFWKRVCVPLPWRSLNLQDEGRKLKWGIMWDDGSIPPTPACRRALSTVAAALRKQGHEVVDFHPPDVVAGLQTGYKLLLADGGHQVASPLQSGESLVGPAVGLLALFNLPRIVKKAAGTMHPRTLLEDREAIVERDEYRARWHEKWISEGLDFVLTKATLMSVGYTFLFSLLDYTAGVFPVTKVDKDVDALPADFESTAEFKSLNSVAKGAYSVYDAQKMHGLPLGVQIVGRRMEEEKVLEGMKVAVAALNEHGLSPDIGVIDF
ncbi:amidase signature domain-containing protein [Ephemerocybe angulata]|uniref:Amidase signature domain-containing protein n=1 Tax=Ephemerocybe angulata TaxID=980116 RepID=A0A8H6I0G5_9AGAR|nr:amidase signature domain-containing protein [Tulosesus angulatus]